MSANLIIFDGYYTADQMRAIDKARKLVEDAIKDIQRASNHDGWKCPESTTINNSLNNIETRLQRLDSGIIRTGIALGRGLKGLTELEERAAAQADGLSVEIQEKSGYRPSNDASDPENNSTPFPTTILPPSIATIGAAIAEAIKTFIDKIFGPKKDTAAQEKAQHLANFFNKNFPWINGGTKVPTIPIGAPTLPTGGVKAPTLPPSTPSAPTQTPSASTQTPAAPTPAPQAQSGGWDASGGWDTVGDSFPNKKPNFNSVYYSGENPRGRQLAYGKEGRHGSDSIDCCFYARARAMEVNGWTKTYGTYTKDRSTDAIKAGNRVVRFDTGRGDEMHFVFVEHYDPDTNTVYFSDANMGGSPATDGRLQAKSFDDFLNYFPNGRYVYTENP